MEVREFASTLLFEPSLEAKLVDPGRLSDREAGPGLSACETPARAPELRLRTDRVPFPTDSELATQEEARGRALHFFANHELLAIELMALVLLRFPEAPSAFRRGLCAIIREEQEHLRLYLEGMARCGTRFGAQPVNDWFWRSLKDVPDLEAFSAGMSLVFEQANLDHALFYEGAFRRAGDAATADVLRRIYIDEIRHVRHGLRWFRRWHEGQALWEAWLRRLPGHLRPGHAKGRRFFEAARRAVGFEDEFISRLRVEGEASSRPPVLWRFGLRCEEEIAAGAPLREVRGATELDRELEPVLLLLAHRKDAVWLRERPALDHLERLEEAGFALPEILTGDPATALGPRSLSDLRPWGWSPGSAAELDGLRERLIVGPERPPVMAWRAELARLSSKAFAVELLRAVQAAGEDPDGVSAAEEHRVCSREEEAAAAVADLVARGHASAVIKAPYSAAGRHRRQVHEGRVTEEVRGFVRRTLERQQVVVIEPWHERRADFSLHLEAVRPGEVRLRGLTRFLTNPKGQYLGTVLGPEMRGLDEELRRFLHQRIGRQPRIAHWCERVRQELEARSAAVQYSGPLGVDLYVHRTSKGLRLRPISEVNARYTMGRVALDLHRRVAPGAKAAWLHLPRASLREAGHPDLPHFLAALGPAAEPVFHEDGAGRRLREGVLATTPWDQRSSVATLLVAGPALAETAARLEPFRKAGLPT